MRLTDVEAEIVVGLSGGCQNADTMFNLGLCYKMVSFGVSKRMLPQLSVGQRAAETGGHATANAILQFVTTPAKVYRRIDVEEGCWWFGLCRSARTGCAQHNLDTVATGTGIRTGQHKAAVHCWANGSTGTSGAKNFMRK
jgi:hypothetical protein